MALYRGETRIGGIGNATTYVTQEEYDCLPSTKLCNNVNYGIYESDGTYNTLCCFIKNGTEYCLGGGGGTKYGYVDILLVGGGGGGGYSNTSFVTGGGGGGGFVECISYPINSGTLQYGVTIGGGGQTQGGNSSALGLTAYGGAMGRNSSGGVSCGATGGGGAGGGYEPYTPGYGPSYQGQGCCGGNGVYCTAGGAPVVGGGGGGAGSNGCNGIYNTQSGNGGAGKCSSISGELQWYSGGGGGGAENNDIAGLGGCGGGGNGGKCGCNGTYYGGGGGGNGCNTCRYSTGCQGIVIIRYKTDGSCGIKNTSAGGCKYTCGDYTIHCFTNTSLTECFVPVFK